MTLTGRQIREARTLLGLTRSLLAYKVARITTRAIHRAEEAEDETTLTPEQADVVRQTLERLGIEFTPEGVRTRKPSRDPLPDLAILRHLAGRPYASAAAIGTACRMTTAEVRARLVMLESMQLVEGWKDSDASRTTPRRVYAVTAEGRGKAGASDARSTTV